MRQRKGKGRTMYKKVIEREGGSKYHRSVDYPPSLGTRGVTPISGVMCTVNLATLGPVKVSVSPHFKSRFYTQRNIVLSEAPLVRPPLY